MNKENVPKINIVDHYINSINFEKFKSPRDFPKESFAPKTDLVVDIKINEKKDDAYEVVLVMTAKISHEKDKIFELSLEYGGLCILKDIEDAQKDDVLNVYCPSYIFPFARRVIADVTRDAGYHPMLINGIDFATIYNGKKKDSKSDAIM